MPIGSKGCRFSHLRVTEFENELKQLNAKMDKILELLAQQEKEKVAKGNLKPV